MAGSVSGLHVFAADVGPEALSLLDGNYGTLTTALNTLLSYSNSYADSGAVNSLVVTVPAPQVFAYSDGVILQVKVAVTTTSATPTINVNALGAKSIVNPDGSALAIGQLVGGGWAQLQYEGTSGKFQVISVGLGFSPADVARLSVANSFAAQNTFTQSGGGASSAVFINAATQPGIGLRDAAAGADAKVWDFTTNATDLLVRAINDAASIARIAMDFTRSGVGLTAITFGNASDIPPVRAFGPTAGAAVDMSPDTGTFTGTFTGFTGGVTGTVTWSRIGKLVVLNFPGTANGTSNATTFTMTGLPAAIQPATLASQSMALNVMTDNSAIAGVVGSAQVAAGSGTITFNKLGGWTASGTKGFATSQNIAYLLN